MCQNYREKQGWHWNLCLEMQTLFKTFVGFNMIRLTSEQTRIGLLPQPCFFKGRGFKEIICLAWYELENDFRCIAEVDPTLLCFAGGGTDKLALTWPPSCPSASEIPEKGSILWWRIWGIGLIAATFNLFRAGSRGMVTPFTNPAFLSSLSILLEATWLAQARSLWCPGLVCWDGSTLFLLGGGGLNQLGILMGVKLLFWI